LLLLTLDTVTHGYVVAVTDSTHTGYRLGYTVTVTAPHVLVTVTVATLRLRYVWVWLPCVTHTRWILPRLDCHARIYGYAFGYTAFGWITRYTPGFGFVALHVWVTFLHVWLDLLDFRLRWVPLLLICCYDLLRLLLRLLPLRLHGWFTHTHSCRFGSGYGWIAVWLGLVHCGFTVTFGSVCTFGWFTFGFTGYVTFAVPWLLDYGWVTFTHLRFTILGYRFTLVTLRLIYAVALRCCCCCVTLLLICCSVDLICVYVYHVTFVTLRITVTRYVWMGTDFTLRCVVVVTI